MRFLNLSELESLGGEERVRADRLTDKIFAAVRDEQRAATRDGVDDRRVASLIVSALVINAARVAVTRMPAADRERLAFSFLRCASDAISAVCVGEQGRRGDLPH